MVRAASAAVGFGEDLKGSSAGLFGFRLEWQKSWNLLNYGTMGCIGHVRSDPLRDMV